MKKYAIAIIAVVMALGAVAFTKPHPKPTFNTFYFLLDGSGAPLSYQKSTNNAPNTSPQTTCTVGSIPCEAGYPGVSITGTGPYTYTATGAQVSGTLTEKN